VRSAWEFGAGCSEVTTSPHPSHTYRRAVRYRAVLTVTDWTGTSMSVVFTGHQLLRNGGPFARTVRQLTVPG